MRRFGVKDVRITDPVWEDKIIRNAAFLDAVDPERVLAGFWRTCGILTDAEPYGGWENSLIAGHAAGHFFSALAMRIAYLRGQAGTSYPDDADRQSYLKALEHSVDQADTIIAGLSECQASLGSGFLSAATVQEEGCPEIQFDVLEGKAEAGQWVPWYTLHKILQGVMDLWQYAGIEGADKVTLALAGWVCDRVLLWDDEMRRKVLTVEYGGMNDTLYRLFDITGDERYKMAAHVFDEPGLYEDLLGFRNRMAGNHANATIPKIIGYLAGREENSLDIAERFWDKVVRYQSYPTGGIGDMEHFFEDGMLDASRTQCNAESCCSYNMMKLSQDLWEKTCDIKYIEFIEKTLWNAKLGSVGPMGGYTYFNPMATGYYRLYSSAMPEDNPFWCCVATGYEDFTKVGDKVFYRDGDDVMIAQWISSTVRLSDDAVLALSLDFDKGQLMLELEGRAEGISVRLRIPRWIKNRAKILPDEEDLLSCVVSSGEPFVMDFEMELEAHSLPDAPAATWFSYGPFVLCVPLGNDRWGITVDAGIQVTAPAWKVVFDAAVKGDVTYGKTQKCVLDREFLTLPDGVGIEDFREHPDRYITAEGGSTFRLSGLRSCKGEAVELTLIPYYQAGNERYGIFWYLVDG